MPCILSLSNCFQCHSDNPPISEGARSAPELPDSTGLVNVVSILVGADSCASRMKLRSPLTLSITPINVRKFALHNIFAPFYFSENYGPEYSCHATTSTDILILPFFFFIL